MSSLMESHLIASINEHLSLHLTQNSIFLAERLVAQFPSETNLLLLATCYHRSGETFRAYHLLKGLGSDSCRYLFAVCCVELGKYTEAEAALLPNNDAEKVPNGAAGMYLLGKVYQLSNRHTAAITNFRNALHMDPLMWCAFEELCLLGAEQETKSFLQLKFAGMDGDIDTASPTNFLTPAAPQQLSSARETGGEKTSGKLTGTPLDNVPMPPKIGNYETPEVAPQAAQPPPVKKYGKNEDTEMSGSPMLLSSQEIHVERKFLDEGTMRKISSKLFAEPATALKLMQASMDDNSSSEQIQNLRQCPASTSGSNKSLEGQAACLSLLQSLGEGYRFLCFYQCEEALKAFSKIPLPHYSTGWVLQAIGQTYYEMVDYQSAERTFQQLRQIDPCRLEGLEVYSTVLWHMKKEVELSNLAQEAVSLDRHSPISWCIMGNCFSLQKEHETALRFFQRSLQLDPTFPYAYTLCGHEYFANEDFEKGLTCYRNAIRLNPRHYNAWFGSGHIYYRQEKYGMAEYHFRRAHHINKRSSVLKCYLGMALNKVKRTGEALVALKQAVESDPRNPLARFELASVLVSIGRLEEATNELTALHDVAPKEASVLFQKGKILKKMGQLDKALVCFSDALDLQPPSVDTNLIKAAIDRISVEDVDEDEEL